MAKDKISIRSAFSKDTYISICYMFIDQCPHCHTLVTSFDSEYCFNGSISDFFEWLREYPLLTLDDLVYFDTELHAYVYEHESWDDVLCSDCARIDFDY